MKIARLTDFNGMPIRLGLSYSKRFLRLFALDTIHYLYSYLFYQASAESPTIYGSGFG